MNIVLVILETGSERFLQLTFSQLLQAGEYSSSAFQHPYCDEQPVLFKQNMMSTICYEAGFSVIVIGNDCLPSDL